MKKVLFLSILISAALQLAAAPVDVATARATAQQFMATTAHAARRAAPAGNNSLTLIHTEKNSATSDQAVFYIFNTDDSYIIVAGDDRATDVLAYGDAPMDISNLPDGMKYWLDCYKLQIEYLEAHPELVVEKSARRARAPQAESVEPLLTALWDQSSPYYNQCPTSGGRRCLTGCPATSLAMVFYYWKYPTGPTPAIPGYVTSSLRLRLDELPSTTFDWDNMIDYYGRGGYSSEQSNAVAWLMRYLGQAEEMDYAPDGSGSYGENILETVKLFGYDEDAQLIYKTWWNGQENYSDDEWAEVIQEELYASRPIVMCGYANSMEGLSGHAFNIDGYDAERDMYHINWGWSGSSNAHFALNAFRGGSMTFNIMQQLIIGIEPPAQVPTIKPRVKRMALESLVDYNATQPLVVKGALLTDDVQLELNDNSGYFALSTDHISLNDLTTATTVNVTYTPLTSGTHTAVLTLKSNGARDVQVTLTGTAALETYTPQMAAMTADAPSSIVAQWDDETPAKNVNHYRLEVAKVPYSELSIQQRFVKEEASWTGSSDCSSHLDQITTMPGWSGNKVYQGEDYLRLGSTTAKGWLATPALDMRDSEGLVTVKINAKCVSNDINAPLKITCGENDTTIMLTPQATDYCLLLPCPIGDDVTVTLANAFTGKRVLVHDIQVLAGDDYSPIDQSTTFCLEGIGSTSCQVSGLVPATYAVRVQAVYTDGTISAWSDRMRITLNGPAGDVNSDGEVNIADVNSIIGVMIAGNASRRQVATSDVNGDGEVNLGDINMVIDKILNTRKLL